jgi:UDP-N-acetylmuramoyl-L-alanyl-D-glutamate--2,6-diaminopimelate ligase
VLGNTGGGRDTWKRKGMAEVADTHCDHIILTNEDPYDEDPMKIINDMKVGISKKPLEIIMDRRKAINTALRMANKESRDEKRVTVLISGKGTDPYIMEANGKKTPWDDADVVREELEKILS